MWQSAAQYNGWRRFSGFAFVVDTGEFHFQERAIRAQYFELHCHVDATRRVQLRTRILPPTLQCHRPTALRLHRTSLPSISLVILTSRRSMSCGCLAPVFHPAAATLPLPSAAVTVQAEMGPLGTALSSSNGAQTGLATGLIPRYQDTPQPAAGLPVILFPPSQTTLLITYAVVVPGFNTGIAISNTTNDPFGPSGGGATPTAGTIVFSLFKNDGSLKLFTSPSVAPGTTYAANLSDIISTAGAGATWSGYIFAQANFPQAHGAATIYETATGAAALSTPTLVVTSNGQQVTLANPRVSPEALDQ